MNRKSFVPDVILQSISRVSILVPRGITINNVIVVVEKESEKRNVYG
jgi:hypothetical protein